MDNRYFNILAHPTGRLLGERPGYAVDIERVMAAAKERGCFLEVNAHPTRLDLDDVHCRAAKEMGLEARDLDRCPFDARVLPRCATAWIRRGAAGLNRATFSTRGHGRDLKPLFGR